MARGKHLWFNGKIQAVAETQVSLFTYGLHYGMGAFEGIRAYEQNQGGIAIFRLDDHIDRFIQSFKILGFDLPFVKKSLIEACIDVCKKNQFKSSYLRPIAFIGDGPLGLNVGENPPIDVAVLNWEWGDYLGEEGVKNGTRLKISSFTRPHVNSVMTKGKITGQYVSSVMAKREAILDGFDEAIFLDPEGFIAEGSGENVFIIRNGEIKTTPLTSVLAGITRMTVMDYFKNKGIPVKEARFSRDELWCADEVFVCGTAAEITPVREIDRRTIGEGKPGPVTTQLQKDYSQIVRGEVPQYGSHWLTKV